jgi:hypothetical protein
MQGAAARLRDGVRTQLWPLPVAGVAGTLLLGVLLPRLDARIGRSLPSWLAGVLFGGDPAATAAQARTSTAAREANREP